MTIRRFAGLSLLSVAASLVYVHAFAAYYAMYHLGTPGAGVGLIFIDLPIAVLVSLSVAAWISAGLGRRGWPSHVQWVGAAVGVAVILGAALAFEIWRTTAARSGEGEGAGDLTPYFMHHMRND